MQQHYFGLWLSSENIKTGNIEDSQSEYFIDKIHAIRVHARYDEDGNKYWRIRIDGVNECENGNKQVLISFLTNDDPIYQNVKAAKEAMRRNGRLDLLVSGTTYTGIGITNSQSPLDKMHNIGGITIIFK